MPPPNTHCLCQTDANAIGVKNLITVLVFRVEVAKYLYLHSRLSKLKALYCPPTTIYGRGNSVNAVNVARKTTTSVSVDIAEPFYIVTHNVLELRPFELDSAQG